MSNHSAKFFAAIFASILAGASFATVPESGAKTADNCLSAPKGAIPAGHHWYYRIEQPSKRQCWYSRAEKDKAATDKTAGATSPPQDSTSEPPSQAAQPSAAADPAPAQNLLVRKSIADARAELTSPKMRVEDMNNGADPQRGGTPPAASLPDGQRAVAPTAAASSSVASRWPESSGVASSSSDPRLAAAEPPASPQARAAPAPKPATTPVALAAADSSLERQSASLQMLLAVMAGALALAGVTASLVFRFARANAPQRDMPGDRRPIWEMQAPRASPSLFPDEQTPIWRGKAASELPADPRAPDDPERRVTEMLARLARSAQH